MRRREFIARLGTAAAALPLATKAQQLDAAFAGMWSDEPARCIGALMNLAADDPEALVRVGAFAQGLAELGWTIGHNLRIEYRWSAGDTALNHKFAAELIALRPNVVLAAGTLSAASLQQISRAVPIVFVNATDPVGARLVDSLARPGGNTTGFMLFEYNSSGKWLELLKEIAPWVARAAVLWDSDNPAGSALLSAIQGMAPSIGLEVTKINARDASEIERGIASFAEIRNGGLIVTGSALALHRRLIVTLAEQYRLPAVYARRLETTGDELISYGPDVTEQYRRAAGYVARILEGAKASDMPVQAPTKYELVINVKTAKALGLTAAPALLARADEVIE
jgi:putative tryptophan/tyrosine transport system substrate-binding protein